MSQTRDRALRGTYLSFPDYLDPGLSFTPGRGDGLHSSYIPLLTYAPENGKAGTELIPGLAKALPKIDQGGRRFTLFLRPGLEYSDGTPVRASDFRFAIERLFRLNSAGSSFYTGIVGAERFAKTKKGGIEGITTDDESGKIVIRLVEPSGFFSYVLGAAVRGLAAARDAGRRPDGRSAARHRPLHDHRRASPAAAGNTSATRPGRQTGRRCRTSPTATSTRSSSKSAPTRIAAGRRGRKGQGRLDEKPAAARTLRGRAGPLRGDAVPRGTDDQRLLLLDEHPGAALRRRAGAAGGQLRGRPRGAGTHLRRHADRDPAGAAVADAGLPEVRALPARPGEGEEADRRSRPGRPRDHRLDPQPARPPTKPASTTSRCWRSSASTSS